MIRMNSKLELIKSITLFEGDYASRINNIKAVAYGKNILIGYSLVQEKYVNVTMNY